VFVDLPFSHIITLISQIVFGGMSSDGRSGPSVLIIDVRTWLSAIASSWPVCIYVFPESGSIPIISFTLTSCYFIVYIPYELPPSSKRTEFRTESFDFSLPYLYSPQASEVLMASMSEITLTMPGEPGQTMGKPRTSEQMDEKPIESSLGSDNEIDEQGYPKAFKLVMIVVALVLSMFLVSEVGVKLNYLTASLYHRLP
jgi:hypothetical protein